MGKYILLDNEGIHEYTIIKETDVDGLVIIYLYHSMGEQWTEKSKGKLIMTITDDGNGISFNKNIVGKQGYDDFLYLRIMVNFYYKYDDFEFKESAFEVIEVKNTETV